MLTLRPYQQDCKEIIDNLPPGSYLAQMATGLGKCFAAGTKILMYDGSIKVVEDIHEGDAVMGPDSLPRYVSGLARGEEMMYEICPVKGDTYTVNESHILSLKITNTGRQRVSDGLGSKFEAGEICNISVKDYLSTSKTFKHVAKGWRVGVDFPKREVLVPPHILGLWLGDGHTSGPQITTMEPEVVKEVHKYASQNGMSVRVCSSENTGKAITYSISGAMTGHGCNPLRSALSSYGLNSGKYIPSDYLHNDRESRLELLAGLMDSDGYLIDGTVFEITTVRSEMADGILYLARSLGFAAYCSHKKVAGAIYYRISISGDTHLIPTRVERRKASERKQKKDVLMTGISVEPAGIGDYYGFELIGPDRLFLLGDFTVAHNTVTFASIDRPGRMLILSHREELVRQPLKYFDCPTGVEMAGESAPPSAEVVSASVQSLTRRLNRFDPGEFDIIVTDEAHHAAAQSYRRIYDYFSPRLHIGFTATPGRGDKVRLDDIFSDIIFARDLRWGIENNYLSDIYCRRVNIGFDLRNVRSSRGDYAPGELEEAMEGTADAIAEAYRDMATGATLIFAVSVNQANEIAKRIPGAVVVTGETKNRAAIIEAFTQGEIPCIVNCMVFTEGTDIPRVETIIIARPTQSDSLYTQMVGRGLRLYPGKKQLNLIDCVGITGRASLCTAPSLLGIDMDQVPVRKAAEVEGMLFDLPVKAAGAADCPESWVKNIEVVNLWAMEQKFKMHDVNWFRMPDGSLVCSLPERQSVRIGPMDELGRVEYQGLKMPMQHALDRALLYLEANYPSARPIWDLNKSKYWSKSPASEKQLAIIKRKCKGFDASGLNKFEASQILNRVLADSGKRKAV